MSEWVGECSKLEIGYSRKIFCSSNQNATVKTTKCSCLHMDTAKFLCYPKTILCSILLTGNEANIMDDRLHLDCFALRNQLPARGFDILRNQSHCLPVVSLVFSVIFLVTWGFAYNTKNVIIVF